MQKVRVGIAGLGRLGKIHAQNIAYSIPGAELSAACSIVEQELEFARKELGVKACYSDFNQMLENKDLDAVAIVTTSSEHCWQIEAALGAGKHVFSEKPLGTNVEQCRQAEKAVEKHPDKVFLLGFMRRFDPSYAYAMEKIKKGDIGTPYMFRGAGADPRISVEEMLKYTGGKIGNNGDIFLDLGIHDMDLCRWFLGEDPEEVYAIGGSYKYPQFEEAGDAEAASAIFRFKSGKMGMLYCARAAVHGYHIETEIIGTEGAIRISPVPQKNMAQLFLSSGVVTECMASFPERFAEAYRLEVEEFIICIRQGKKPDVLVQDGTKSTQIALATSRAFKTGATVKIDY